MADENESSQEKTEEATPRRQEEARKKGQVGRSREFNTMILLMVSAGIFLLIGKNIMHSLLMLMQHNFLISRNSIFDPHYPIIAFERSIIEGLLSITPIFIALSLVALLAPMVIGGWMFSIEALKPKFEKLNPINGMKRLFGMNSMMELLKAFLKFLLVCSLLVLWLWLHTYDMLQLGQGELKSALVNAGIMLATSFIFLSLSTVIISSFDVPFQLWDHKRKLKMTKQELKDEFKETEGKPEVKQQIRSMQKELANRRMMEAIPTADVIITNPTHYAVALQYTAEGMSAPKVVAKGIDSLAERIKVIATENQVIIYPAPLLARALYNTTKLNQEIPEGLYVAVAQVLAYIFQLKANNSRQYNIVKPSDDLPIPPEFRFD